MGLNDEERDALITYRLDKSRIVLVEAHDVAQLRHWNLTVNRLYYSVFHMSSALLLSRGFNAKTHSGVIQIMMREFVKPGIISRDEGGLISTLFSMRNTGDYDDLFDWSEAQVMPLIEPTEKLLTKIEQLIIK